MSKSLAEPGNGKAIAGSNALADAEMTTFIEGLSLNMRPVTAVIRELAQSDVPVLLLAERGAGKHATARRIHELSRRSAQPFRWFPCSTLKPADLEDFQSAGEMQDGPGTVFLEELADLNSECQRYLQNVLSAASNGAGGKLVRFICGSGGRAAVVEEAISIFLFNEAAKRGWFRDESSIDIGLLKTIMRLTAGLEVQRCTAKQWKTAILQGYAAFESLQQGHGGRVDVDLDGQTLRYFPPDVDHGESGK